MYCVGLTGNIASGKSTVARLFADKGISVISADEIARALTQPGKPALAAIIRHFGKSIVDEDGTLKRRRLRQIIFNDDNARQWLENLLHPLIREGIKDAAAACQPPYCVIEIPLLPQKKDYPYLDRIIFVEAEREQQIERLIKRDHCSREDALKILQTQSSPKLYKKTADNIVKNNGSLKDLEHSVDAMHRSFLQNI